MDRLFKPTETVFLTKLVVETRSTVDGETEGYIEYFGTSFVECIPEENADVYAEYVPKAALDEALEALRLAKALISDMSRFAGQMALQDYALFNAAPLAIDAILAKHPESASKEIVEDDYGARDMLAHSRGEFERHAPDQPRDSEKGGADV